MKDLFIPAALLAALLALALWNARAVEKDVGPWCEILREASAAATREDWEAAKAHLDAFADSWQRRRTYYHIVLEHDELDDAEEFCARALSALSRRAGDAFAAETAALISQLRVLAEMQGLSVENIL